MDNILRLSAAFNNSLTNAFKPRKQINRSTQQQEAHQPDAESTRDGETQENQRASENTLRDNNIPEHGNLRSTVRTDGEPRNQEKVVSTNERIGTQGKSVETENRIKAVQDLFKNIRWHRGERGSYTQESFERWVSKGNNRTYLPEFKFETLGKCCRNIMIYYHIDVPLDERQWEMSNVPDWDQEFRMEVSESEDERRTESNSSSGEEIAEIFKGTSIGTQEEQVNEKIYNWSMPQIKEARTGKGSDGLVAKCGYKTGNNKVTDGSGSYSDGKPKVKPSTSREVETRKTNF